MGLRKGEFMEEREKEIIRTISKAYPEMSDFQRGYLLGVAESMKEEKKKSEFVNKEPVAV